MKLLLMLEGEMSYVSASQEVTNGVLKRDGRKK
jgi:hypothetical protein